MAGEGGDTQGAATLKSVIWAQQAASERVPSQGRTSLALCRTSRGASGSGLKRLGKLGGEWNPCPDNGRWQNSLASAWLFFRQ